jgi:hypothetical protein
VFAAGDSSYPLINYEYAVLSTRQANPETAPALREFLLWAISLTGGNAPKYKMPSASPLHPAAGFHPRPEPEADRPDQNNRKKAGRRIGSSRRRRHSAVFPLPAFKNSAAPTSSGICL